MVLKYHSEPGLLRHADVDENFRYLQSKSLIGYTSTETANYQAIAGDIVEVDVSAGTFTVTAPANPIQDQLFAVKIIVAGNSLVVSSGTASKIESHIASLAASATIALVGLGRYAEWRYDAVLDVWLAVAGSKNSPYVELWSATPIVDISPVTVIQWTFQPLYPGQVPLIATNAAGVFTLQDDMDLNLDGSVHHEFVSNANNSQAAATFSSVAVAMTGTLLAFSLRDSMTAPRASLTEPFIRSGQTLGKIINGVAGDTFRFDATEVYGTSMSVNLDAALLSLSL